MFDCVECGNPVEEGATECAHCGCPFAPGDIPDESSSKPEAAIWIARPGSKLAIWWTVFTVLAAASSLIVFHPETWVSFRFVFRGGKPFLPTLIPWIAFRITAGVLFLVWLYKAWDAVLPEFRSAEPGQAVGLLFLPLYNYYWIFRAVPGLSRSIARAARATGRIEVGGAGFGIGLAASILKLIPLASVLSWMLFIAWVHIADSAKNRMLRGIASERAVTYS